MICIFYYNTTFIVEAIYFLIVSNNVIIVLTVCHIQYFLIMLEELIKLEIEHR